MPATDETKFLVKWADDIKSLFEARKRIVANFQQSIADVDHVKNKLQEYDDLPTNEIPVEFRGMVNSFFNGKTLKELKDSMESAQAAIKAFRDAQQDA